MNPEVSDPDPERAVTRVTSHRNAIQGTLAGDKHHRPVVLELRECAVASFGGDWCMLVIDITGRGHNKAEAGTR